MLNKVAKKPHGPEASFPMVPNHKRKFAMCGTEQKKKKKLCCYGHQFQTFSLFAVLIVLILEKNCTVQYSALHCTTLHCTVLHCTALYCTALHCTALHCTALHCTALHCTALHCTALHLSVSDLQRVSNFRFEELNRSMTFNNFY